MERYTKHKSVEEVRPRSIPRWTYLDEAYGLHRFLRRGHGNSL